jgi:hypothetical protein
MSINVFAVTFSRYVSDPSTAISIGVSSAYENYKYTFINIDKTYQKG